MNIGKSLLVALGVLLIIAPSAVLAEKGGKHGRGQDKKNEQVEGGRRDSGRASIEVYFGNHERQAVRDYYGTQARGGRCPPGLAKKGNGCMPPGQAKKWAMGQPLPRGVDYHDLPHDLLLRLPPPPHGHRYVQVAGDVLLIAVGSAMVVDAIQDILR